ncbi:hypothetical protein [Plantactinospora sp. GCM10030261]|uniref:hypothetical protein n=1 Tax=Plantactinospora sp. GCM10030261 TaxID=3273420 RepID=UPI003620F631
MTEPAAGPAATTAADDGRWRIRHLPVLIGVSGVLVVLAAIAGGLVAGVHGAIGAATGVSLVTVGYVLSTLVVAWADSVHPRLVLPFGLGVYGAKIVLFGAVTIALAAQDWAGFRPFLMGIAVGAVGWTGAHIWWISTVHARGR